LLGPSGDGPGASVTSTEVCRTDARKATRAPLPGSAHPKKAQSFLYGGRKRVWRETHRRRRRREHRAERRRFDETKFGRPLYRRRSRTVEPFFGRFKEVFELDERLWHAGLGNNRTMTLAALLLYQILLVYNRIKGPGNAEVKGILDLL
jgi:hypothetical protein